MGGENSPTSVEEGVDTALWLGTLPGNGPTGGFSAIANQARGKYFVVIGLNVSLDLN